jgi:hypothetical protein
MGMFFTLKHITNKIKRTFKKKIIKKKYNTYIYVYVCICVCLI